MPPMHDTRLVGLVVLDYTPGHQHRALLPCTRPVQNNRCRFLCTTMIAFPTLVLLPLAVRMIPPAVTRHWGTGEAAVSMGSHGTPSSHALRRSVCT